MTRVWHIVLLLLTLPLLASCDRGNTNSSGSTPKKLTIGVAFDTLQTEYWVFSLQAIEAELKKHDAEMLHLVADNDANRQMEQVQSLIARKVDGIIIAPRDAQTVGAMIKAANRANIPVVIYNRPPADSAGKSVTIVADNQSIARSTVQYMAEQAKKTGKKHKAMLLIGDLGDINAIGRRDGFDEVVKQYPDTIEVVARISTEWKQEKAMAGVTNALQANPDISFIFTSSDFLFPSIVSALKAAGKYKKVGEEGHVLLGGFDGDGTAWQLLQEGYVDADGVQDLFFECQQTVQALMDLRAGKPVDPIIRDPGFVVHQGNMKEVASRVWGANIKK